MDNDILLDNIYNSYIELFGNKQLNDFKLVELGFIPTNCNTPKLSMLIHCMENMDLFDDKQKENINIMIMRYKDGRKN